MKDKLVVEGRPVPLVEDEVGSQKLLMGILTRWCREYQTVSWAGMEEMRGRVSVNENSVGNIRQKKTLRCARTKTASPVYLP